MKGQEVKVALLEGADLGKNRALIVDALREIAEDVKGFVEAIEKTADELEAEGGDERAAALQVAIARRIFEEVNSEAGDLFDALVWAGGFRSEAEEALDRGEEEKEATVAP